MVQCRGDTSPVSAARSSSGWPRMLCNGNTLTRAAASSSASGRPSKRTHNSASGRALASVSAKLGSMARAWCRNSATDGTRASASSVGSCSRSGIARGGTGNTRSQRSRRRARLVTRILRLTHSVRSRDKPGAASATCSKLSSTSSTRPSPMKSSTRSMCGRSPVSRRPSVRAIADWTSRASASGTRSTRYTPPSNTSSRLAATSSASRVLPVPPGPVRVSRRTGADDDSSCWRALSNSRSRPTSGVGCAGKLCLVFRRGLSGIAGEKYVPPLVNLTPTGHS